MRQKQQGHPIAGAFVFLLLGAFALMSTMLVLFGVQAYRHSIAQSDANNETRLLSFYLRSMLRNADEEGRVGTETSDGISVLYYRENYDGETYVTRIYSYDGMLREWFSEADREFVPGDGEELFAAETFAADLEDGIVTAVLKGPGDEEEITVNIAVFSEI